MISIRKKRQQMIKQARTRQRKEIFQTNRGKNIDFQFQDNQSLIQMIFLFLDQDLIQKQDKLTQNDFEQFLILIQSEVLECQSMQTSQKEKISMITQTISKRYQGKLKDFEKEINASPKINKINVLIQNSKMFNLIRFLLRIKGVTRNFLIIFDDLLDSNQLKLNEIIKKCQKNTENQSLHNQLIQTYQLNYKILKQIAYLYYFSLKATQEKQEHNFKQIEIDLSSTVDLQQVIKFLVEKWFVKNVFVDFLLNFNREDNFVYSKKSFKEQFCIEIDKLIDLFCIQIIQNDKVILSKIVEQFAKSPEKFLELLFFLLKPFYSENSTQNTKIEYFSLFLNVHNSIIKLLQSNKSCAQSSSSSEIIEVNFDSTLLKMLMNLLIQNPLVEISNFLQKAYSLPKQKANDITKFFGSFLYSNDQQNKKLTQINSQTESLTSNNKYASQLPIIITLLHKIQDFQYRDLLNFIQTISIVSSYNENIILLLFQEQKIEGYYGQTFTFESLLQKRLLRHLSIQIRRMSYWLLTNIAGSQSCYIYCLNFIKSFFFEDILKEDFSSLNLTKQQLLIRQSILQILMNYLSNLRNQKQVQQLFQITKNNQESNKNSQCQQFPQTLMVWILKIFGSIIKGISQNIQFFMESENLFQILIYSLFNLLSLQKSQNDEKQSILLQLLERYQITKNLQFIYQNIFLQKNRQSVTSSMVEKLLDQIQKTKCIL